MKNELRQKHSQLQREAEELRSIARAIMARVEFLLQAAYEIERGIVPTNLEGWNIATKTKPN